MPVLTEPELHAVGCGPDNKDCTCVVKRGSTDMSTTVRMVAGAAREACSDFSYSCSFVVNFIAEGDIIHAGCPCSVHLVKQTKCGGPPLEPVWTHSCDCLKGWNSTYVEGKHFVDTVEWVAW